MGQRPSFAWRSILYGRELMIQGLEKRVCNGALMFVWIDPWIEDNRLRAPWRKNQFFDVGLKIKDLIDLQTGFWDNEILEELFFPQDIIRIKAVKPVISQEDFHIWKHNKNGDFSVKSAYWMAHQVKSKELIQIASLQSSTLKLKKLVWKLQTDPKIKVFLWKLLSGAIPVAESLNGRGMTVDENYQVCGEKSESINHFLFLCPLSRQVWALSEFPFSLEGFHSGSIYSNMFHLLENKDNKAWPPELRKSFPWIVWRIWTNRNSLTFEGKCFNARETVEKIREEVAEWFEAQCVGEEGESLLNQIQSEGQRNEVTQTGRWKKPPENWLKCNVGASWSRRNQNAGGAWVLRDDRGVVLLHSRRSFANIHSKGDASLRCLLWAFESMASHKVDNVIFALSDKELVGAAMRPSAWPSFKPQSVAIKRSLLPFAA
ncbi:PREDICTED: uncharacterized protein LOC104720029 [Camelina sativa]|uniref:Uncharacterized protein LOC104720029 n=1 Tax=Camelina sativa TaxID=90675 RepID=A0ABM0U5V7_CAMSA|nr:PREDICTED: uncharacterized protein LOC104720029 [Camelina sativa]